MISNIIKIEEEDIQSGILSDKGISQAIELDMIRVNPSEDLKENTKRIQPATLDVKINEINISKPIQMDEYSQDISYKKTTLQSKFISDVGLTERISISHPEFMKITCEARSSIRRLGGFIPYQGNLFFSDAENSRLKIGNFSCNDIHFKEEDRLAQLFFSVSFSKDYENLTEIYEQIRSLDKGIAIKKNKSLKLLHKKGFMKLSPKLKVYKGLVKVHASDKAYRMKKVDGGIDFNKRDEYCKSELLESIDISKGYTIRPFEHIIIETLEKFELSSHVGIRFWDNFSNQVSLKDKHFLNNIEMYNLTDGWIDPGYNGGFSRQPKWVGKTIYPGDVIGFGQVFYFPKGVGVVYGDEKIGSQYQHNKETKFSD